MVSGSPYNDPDSKTKKSGSNSIYREVSPYLTLGIQLAAAVVIFFFLGNWVDNRFGIDPIGKLVGTLIGMVGGFIKFFRSVASLIAREEKKSNK